MRQYTQLTVYERYQIYALMKAEHTQDEIAANLGRSKPHRLLDLHVHRTQRQQSVVLRLVVRWKSNKNAPCIIVTNLDPHRHPADMIRRLYRLRRQNLPATPSVAGTGEAGDYRLHSKLPAWQLECLPMRACCRFIRHRAAPADRANKSLPRTRPRGAGP